VPLYEPTPEDAARIARRNAVTFGALVGTAGALYYSVITKTDVGYPDPVLDEELVNWSGTHACRVKSLYQPETHQHVEAIVADANSQKRKLRCVGSGLSPNGIAFEKEGMMSLSLMDKVLAVDKDRMRVTVQSGARVQDVADTIRKHGMTLLNYASIREQTVGGFTQIGAHGTGAGIPSVDDSVVGLKLVTPSQGTMYLSADINPDLFPLAKVGLGCLGVVTEVTLQCVPAHKLVERTFVTSIDVVKKNHATWLARHKHLRYMWIPGANTVVVVQCNPEGTAEADAAIATMQGDQRTDTTTEGNPLQKLLQKSKILQETDVAAMSPTECRDILLAHDPLNPTWVSEVNKAEAEFWKGNEGVRVGWSDEILGFDCGGQQWVFEVAFPCGTQSSPNNNDIRYMEELLKLVERNKIPAPSPIEQRWSSGSSSSMSPCSGAQEDLFSWVGIIMYLPEDPNKEHLRDAVTMRFMEYKKLVEQKLLQKYNAVEHWAKIELPRTDAELEVMKKRLHTRYPIEDFQKARLYLDQNNILGNALVDTLFR
jgi:L-galactono-1,4-lactone dehydrogenase